VAKATNILAQQTVLERDMQAKCWTAYFWGFPNLPGCKLPLPYTIEAELYAVAYALRRQQHGNVEIVNKVANRRYSVSFVDGEGR
jgi:hypothetical protein